MGKKIFKQYLIILFILLVEHSNASGMAVIDTMTNKNLLSILSVISEQSKITLESKNIFNKINSTLGYINEQNNTSYQSYFDNLIKKRNRSQLAIYSNQGAVINRIEGVYNDENNTFTKQIKEVENKFYHINTHSLTKSKYLMLKDNRQIAATESCKTSLALSNIAQRNIGNHSREITQIARENMSAKDILGHLHVSNELLIILAYELNEQRAIQVKMLELLSTAIMTSSPVMLKQSKFLIGR